MFKYRSNFKIYSLILFLYFPFIISARQIDTFYGSIEVQEPILLEFIDHPLFQRLKKIHQYGISYYTTHREEYTRYDHSLGVFALLRKNGSSLDEQIAGLLHDVSHTAFSHVGDWIFGKENQEEDYQSSIHIRFLKESGLADILHKYNFRLEQILPKQELFPALECPLPDLCADRIDYNIQGSYYQGYVSYEEALAIFHDLQFKDNVWVSAQPELIKKIGYFSLFMTEDCWGSPRNYLESRWLADAILRGIELGSISYEELHFGTDEKIWASLLEQKDPFIQNRMKMVSQAPLYFSFVPFSQADRIIKSKFRGIDPWILTGPKTRRLTAIDPKFAKEYQRVQKRIKRGWAIKALLPVGSS